jgi:hypothetical protein
MSSIKSAPDMNPSSDPRLQLERTIQQAIRDLPARRAPRSLEQRVLAEIARRAAMPWWRKSFAHWPIAARGVFIVVSAGMIKLALMFGVWVMAGFDTAQFKDAFAVQFTWLENGRAVINALGDFAAIMARNIPPLWLYVGLALFAAMYATLFGLGAAAYRALRADH